MKDKHSILIAVIVLLLLVLFTGCAETRTQSAQQRWQGVMEQARIDAALESVRQGNLPHAIRLFEYLAESDSAFAGQAKQILAELKVARRLIVQARQLGTDPTETN